MADGGASCWTRHFTLEEYVGPTIWTRLILSAGLDSAERLFVSDGGSVFKVESGVASSYIMVQDIIAAIGAPNPVVKQIDRDENDTLYLLVDDDAARPGSGRIMTSTARSQVSTLFQFPSEFQPDLFTVRSAKRLLVTNADPLNPALFALDAGKLSLVYGSQTSRWTNDCVLRSMSVTEDGFLFDLPGCNGSPLVGGRDDGTGLGILLKLTDLNEPYYWNFSGLGRDHQGGAIVGTEGDLFRVGSDGTHVKLDVSPPPVTFTGDLGLSGFTYASIVVSPSCDFYIIDNGWTYRGRPE